MGFGPFGPACCWCDDEICGPCDFQFQGFSCGPAGCNNTPDCFPGPEDDCLSCIDGNLDLTTTCCIDDTALWSVGQERTFTMTVGGSDFGRDSQTMSVGAWYDGLQSTCVQFELIDYSAPAGATIVQSGRVVGWGGVPPGQGQAGTFFITVKIVSCTCGDIDPSRIVELRGIWQGDRDSGLRSKHLGNCPLDDIWLCICDQNIPFNIPSGGTFVYEVPNSCAECPDGSTAGLTVTIRRQSLVTFIIQIAAACPPPDGIDNQTNEFVLSPPDEIQCVTRNFNLHGDIVPVSLGNSEGVCGCNPPACDPLAYCVECNAGTVEAGVLTDGVGAVVCGGPVLTMSDNGDGTVTITLEYQGTRVLGTFDCPIVGCLAFTRLAIPISTLRIGPDCECDTPPPASCDTLAYCVECVSGFVESGILTDGVGVVMCGGPLIIMTDNGDDTVTITQFFDSVFTILGTFDCPVTGCLLFQLDDASTLKLGPACVCE